MSGMGGHQSPRSATTDWLTPKWIIDALGPFDLDPCAAPEPRPWPTAATHWRPEDKPLARTWLGRVWLNPPYGPPHVITPWLTKLADHGNGTALIFARTETAMFQDLVWGRADAVLFLRGRLFFHRPDGTQAEHNGGAPSALVAYGDEDAYMLEHSNLPGAFLRLTGTAGWVAA